MECKDKIPYENKRIAKKARKSLQNKYKTKYKIYICPDCDLYHLSTDLDMSSKVFHRQKKLKDREEWV